MLKEKINADFITAFKSGDTVTKSLLSVVKGEIQTQEKNIMESSLSDENITKILNKFVKSLKETLAANPNDETTQKELTIIEGYLPKQLTTEEIQEIVNKLIESGLSNMGEFMKHFKDLPVDKQIVANIIKQSINR